MGKLKLKIEDLEERIAPSFVFIDGQTGQADPNPVGGQGDYEASFGPDSTATPNLQPWTAHNNPNTPLANGGNN